MIIIIIIIISENLDNGRLHPAICSVRSRSLGSYFLLCVRHEGTGQDSQADKLDISRSSITLFYDCDCECEFPIHKVGGESGGHKVLIEARSSGFPEITMLTCEKGSKE